MDGEVTVTSKSTPREIAAFLALLDPDDLVDVGEALDSTTYFLLNTSRPA